MIFVSVADENDMQTDHAGKESAEKPQIKSAAQSDAATFERYDTIAERTETSLKISLLSFSGLIMAIITVYRPRGPKVSPLSQIFDRHYADFRNIVLGKSSPSRPNSKSLKVFSNRQTKKWSEAFLKH
ncbi:MAG: hypothetical protein GY866_06140 [Proteobacteria bacterium]|nr:hypothetical protein [Pseudomonadota bacterium]